MSSHPDLQPILPKNGQLIIEDVPEFLMCKPRLVPLKTVTLEKLEKMQQEVQKLQENNQDNNNKDTN